jgi:hypothetical protein
MDTMAKNRGKETKDNSFNENIEAANIVCYLGRQLRIFSRCLPTGDYSEHMTCQDKKIWMNL